MGLLVSQPSFGASTDPAPVAVPRASDPAATPGANGPGSESPRAAVFITCSARDANGAAWFGSEDAGLNPWPGPAGVGIRADPDGRRPISAVAFDCLGRPWIGHGAEGLSVLVRDHWEVHGVGTGLLGEHVSALAASPLTGDMWVATNAGIARYAMGDRCWDYFTTRDGLPSDDIAAIAFRANGDAIVGTQANGLALGHAADGYRRWTSVRAAANRFDQAGDGLAGDLINGILVTTSDRIVVATTLGISLSQDGIHWAFLRGADTLAKAELASRRVENAVLAPAAMLEEYASCLAELADHRLVIGHRIAPPEVMSFDGHGQPISSVAVTPSNRLFCTSVQAAEDTILLGTYGHGVVAVPMPGVGACAMQPASPHAVGDSPIATRTRLPPFDDLIASCSFRNEELGVRCCPLIDDWLTRGSWLGRYGTSWACLCAMDPSPNDIIWGAESALFKYHAHMGEHHSSLNLRAAYVPEGFPVERFSDDRMRYWIHWHDTTNRGSLEIPRPSGPLETTRPGVTARRQSEWDDHGETYSEDYEGPDIVVDLSFPAGTFIYSMYFINKDGHTDFNWYRDYLVRVSAISAQLDRNADKTSGEVESDVVRSRVRNFCGGVYLRFLVVGPAHIRSRIQKSYALNTIISGLFVDRLDAPPSLFDRLREQRMAVDAHAADDRALAGDWRKLLALRKNSPVAWASASRLLLQRLLEDHELTPGPAAEDILGQLGLFTPRESMQHARGLLTVRDIELSLPCLPDLQAPVAEMDLLQLMAPAAIHPCATPSN